MREPAFLQAYFRGCGLDIGGALDPLLLYREFFPLMQDVSTWDWDQGDAQYLHGVDDESYDFVHSSHCLEHMRDPAEALANWFRVVKPGGHLVALVPDEDLYEQGGWPSTFNGDHKVTFTVRKARSWSPASYNLLELIRDLPDAAELKALNVLDASFRFSLPRLDQTMTPVGECAIELVIRKRTGQEIAQGGRLPLEQRGPVDVAGLTEPAHGEAAQVEAGLVRANAEANRSAADEATEATIRRLEHQAQSLRAALHAIETSRTWRVSEPLRRWGTRVKQIAGKLQRG
jgi:SAM-dependent methyltransferase